MVKRSEEAKKLKKWINSIDDQCDVCMVKIETRIKEVVDDHNNDVCSRNKSYRCIDLDGVIDSGASYMLFNWYIKKQEEKQKKCQQKITKII